MVKVTDKQRAQVAHNAERWGLAHLPYAFGKEPGEGASDCSGLTKKVWEGIVSLPHNASAQAEQLDMVSPTDANKSKLLPGDLVFYAGDDGTASNPGHVGVFVRKFDFFYVVAQATSTQSGSEVIKMGKYEQPVGFGFVGHN